MSDERHSPGPWVVEEDGALTSPRIFTKYGAHGNAHPMHVCDIRGWGQLTGTGDACGLPEAEAIAIQAANAALIARAPDLLKALREIEALGIGSKGSYRRLVEAVNIAREALKGLP